MRESKKTETVRGEIKQGISARIRAFTQWMKPDPADPIMAQVGKFLLKLPVLLVVLALSPFAAIILFIVFVATF